MPVETSSIHRVSEWCVHRCECGLFTLKLGSLRLDLTAAEFAALTQLLQKAAAHFGTVASSAEPHESCAARTH